MKKINSIVMLALIAVMSTLSSCKKDKKDPDPRDAFVGNYSLEIGCTNGANGEVEQEVVKSTSNEREIIFEDFMGSGEDVRAEVTGSSFTLKKTTVELEDANGTPFTADLTGTGTLNNKELSIDIKLRNTAVGFSNSCEIEGEKE